MSVVEFFAMSLIIMGCVVALLITAVIYLLFVQRLEAFREKDDDQ